MDGIANVQMDFGYQVLASLQIDPSRQFNPKANFNYVFNQSCSSIGYNIILGCAPPLGFICISFSLFKSIFSDFQFNYEIMGNR